MQEIANFEAVEVVNQQQVRKFLTRMFYADYVDDTMMPAFLAEFGDKAAYDTQTVLDWMGF